MKRNRICTIALVCAALLTACKSSTVSEEIGTVNDFSVEESAVTQTGYDPHNSEIQESITYVWENIGFGGNFIISLEAGNTFQLCEGAFSSFIGRGYYSIEDDVLTLAIANSEPVRTYKFNINEDRTELRFIKDGSDGFMFAEVEDGSLFSTSISHDINAYYETNMVDSDELADIFGVFVLLPENTTWIVNREYHLVDENHLEITYYDSIADGNCVVLAAKNKDLTLPENEYDETLDESWGGKTVTGQDIVVKVQREKNNGKTVLAAWEYNEYRFAIIGEVEKNYESIPKAALNIIDNLN